MRIDLKNVSKIVKVKGEDRKILDKINLSIKDEENIFITGPSGSGKSTLLKILGLLDSDFRGDYLIDGKNIKDYSNKDLRLIKRNKIAFIFQEYVLLEEESLIDNLRFLSDDLEKIREVAEVTELSDYLDIEVYKLSGGQRQRCAIARALASDCEILFADEAFNSLDEALYTKILTYIKKSQIKNFILVSHQESLKEYFDFTSIRLEDARRVN
ncbi:MAG: ATP-binding cassette domain-containing protein [Anaerococcus sp.]|nr:ATP-binding cassette domain-containing protein [Anaerococcus sp.]